MEYLTPDGLTHLVEFGDRLAGRTPAAPATVPSAQPRKYYELTSSPEFINAPHEVKKQMFDQWRATDMAAMLSHPSITDKARMQQEARAMQLFAAEHPAPDNSFFRKPADWGTAFLSGAVSGTGSVIAGVGRAAEIAGFDEAGQSMRDAAIATQEFAQKVEDTLGSDTLKDTRKMEQYRLAQADGQWEEGGATLRNFFASPVLTLSGLLGQITPIALGTLVNPVVGGAVAGTMGVGGANQGSYQSNVQYLTQLNQQDNLGWTDDQIKQIATDAVNGGISASDAVGLLAGVVEMIPVGRAMKSLGFGKKAVNAALTPGVRAAGNAVKKKVANNPSWQNAAREAAEKLVERPNATGEVPGYFSSGAFKYTARELGIDMGAGAVSGALEAVATNLGRIDPEAKFYDDMIPNIVTEMIMSSGFGSVNAISTTGQYRKEFSDHYSQLAAAKGLIDSMVEEGVSPAEIGVPPEDLFGPPPEFVGPQQPFVGPQQPTGGTSGQPTANTGVNPPTGSSASVPPAGSASAGGNQTTTDPATNETATVPTAENPQANQVQSERPVAPENVAPEAPTSDNTAVSDRQQGAQQQPSDSEPATTGATEDTSQRGADTQGPERTGGDGQQTADRANKASLPRAETIDRWVGAETTDSGKVGPDGRDAASYVVHPDLREEAKAVWAEISNDPKYTDRAVRDPVTPKQFASAVAEEIMLRRLADDDAKEGDNLAERARALLGTRGKLQGKVGRARRDLEALSQDYLSGEIGELELLNQAFDVLNRADKEFTARGIDASQYDTGRAEQEAADNVAKVKEREEEDAALRQVQAAATESEVDAAKAKKATNGRKQTTKKSAKKSALKKTNAPVAETVAEPVAEVAPAKKSATKKASANKSALKEPTAKKTAAKKTAAKKTAAKKAATKQAADTRETSKELMEQLIEATADTDLADLDHFIRLAWQRAGTEQKRLRLLSALTRTETFDDAADVLHPLLSGNASRVLSLMVGQRIETMEELTAPYVENIEATGRDLEDQFNDDIVARENAEDIVDVGDADDYSYDYDDITADIDGYGYDDGMDDGRYMRRQGRRSGVSVAEVESIVDDMTADWENKLDTLIHASIEADSVPKVIREYNRDLMAEGATPAVAVLYRGKMHIFADQVESTDEVVQAVLHETIGHHGLRNVFGNALSTILDGFVETNPSQVIRKAKQYGLVPPNLTGLSDAELASRMSKENLRIAAEEVIAEYAESNPRHHTVRRLVASIKQWLRSKFPGLFNTLSDNDIIAQFIIPAQGWVKRGQTTNQGVINVPLFRREDWRDEVDEIRGELNNRSRQRRVADRQRTSQEAAQRAEERRLAQERREAEESRRRQEQDIAYMTEVQYALPELLREMADPNTGRADPEKIAERTLNGGVDNIFTINGLWHRPSTLNDEYNAAFTRVADRIKAEGREPGIYRVIENYDGKNIPSDVIDTLGELFDLPNRVVDTVVDRTDYFTKLWIAGSHSISPNLLRGLARSDDAYLVDRVASNPNLPVNTILELARQAYAQLNYPRLRALASNRRLPREAIEFMLEVPDNDIVKALAANPNTPLAILRDLANRKDTTLPWVIRGAKHMPADLLSELAGSRNPHALVAIAQHPNAPGDALRKVFEANPPYADENLAYHQNTPPDILVKLAKLNEPRVLNVLIQRSNITEDALKHVVKWIKTGSDGISPSRLASANGLHTDIVRAVLGTNDYYLVAAVASNPTLTGDQATLVLKQAQQRLQKDPDDRDAAKVINELFHADTLQVSSVKDATIAGVNRWRREARAIANVVRDGETSLTGIANKTGTPKAQVEATLSRLVGKGVVSSWRHNNQINPALFELSLDDHEYRMMPPAPRGGVQSIAGEDHSISFFREDLADDFEKLYKVQLASSHPPGFGFVLFRYFDDGKSAVITEVQSDVMSVMFDPDKQLMIDRLGLSDEQLARAKENLTPVQKTWPKALLRGAMRQLFDSGVEKIYAITPESMRDDLNASPPMSVVRAWAGQKEAQAEGFGDPVQLTIDGHKITAWDAIRSDSEAAAEIRFKRKANSTGAKVAHNLFKFNKRRPVVTQDEVLRLSKGETFELSRTPSQWLDDALSYIRRKVVDEMDDLKKLSPELHRTFERGIARRNAILAEESKKLDAYAKALSKGVAVLRRRGIRMTEDELSQAAGYYTTAKYAAEANIARYKSWTKEHADNVKEMDALYDEHPQLVVDDERVMGIDDLTGSQRRVVDATIDADASTMPWDQVVEIVRRRSNKVTKTARKRLNEIKERQKYLDDVIAGHERIDHQALSTNELYEALGITEQQAKEEDADTLTEAIDTLTGDTAESPDLKTRYRPIGGMTTGFANQVVSTYESGDMAAVVKDLRNHILAIEKATTKLGDEHGIYTDHHRMGRDGLASYVPTTGDPTRYRAATMMDDATLQLEDWTGSTYGAGINSRAVYRHREGRATLPDSADKAVIDRLYAVVNQIGSKPLKDALAERVFTAADPELAEAFRNGTLTYKQANTLLNSRAGYQSLLDQAGMVLVPAQYSTNEPGHEIHYELQVIGDDGIQTSIPVKIRFADAGISQALIGATSERANSILQFLGGITRFGQRMIVQVDAFFPIKSSFRDVFERINILSTRVLTDVDGKPVSVSLERDLPRLTAQVVKSIRALVRGHGRETSAVWQYAFNRTYTNNADGRLLKEFIDNGGVSTLANTLSSIRANPSKTLRRHSKWRKHVTKASDALTAWGEVFELNVSFNTYKMLRDKGMSEADAAFQVLDGMNFSRKGEWTNTLRPLYYFINPSIQGANNFVKGFKTNPMASVAGLIKWALLGSLAQGALGMIGGGDDDDDVLGNYYDRRPLGWRMRNIAFTIPGGEGSVTIPIAFGMSAVGWGFGQIVRDVTLGKLSAGDAAGELSSLLGAEMTGLPLSDVDFTENPVEWLFRTLLPSSFGGLADAATGKNRWGTEINRAFLQPDQFRHLQGKDNTEATYKAIAEWLHEASGVDMTPEEVKYFITGTLVGPLGRIIKGVETGVGGDPMNGFVTAVGLGAFYSDAPASTIETAYYTRIAEAQELQKELDKTLPKLPGQTETLDELMNRALAAGMSIEDASSIVLTTQVKRNLRGVDKDTRRLFMIEYLRRMNR